MVERVILMPPGLRVRKGGDVGVPGERERQECSLCLPSVNADPPRCRGKPEFLSCHRNL